MLIKIKLKNVKVTEKRQQEIELNDYAEQMQLDLRKRLDKIKPSASNVDVNTPQQNVTFVDKDIHQQNASKVDKDSHQLKFEQQQQRIKDLEKKCLRTSEGLDDVTQNYVKVQKEFKSYKQSHLVQIQKQEASLLSCDETLKSAKQKLDAADEQFTRDNQTIQFLRVKLSEKDEANKKINEDNASLKEKIRQADHNLVIANELNAALKQQPKNSKEKVI